jgi:5'(3')-deoxyribonucleotidase
MSARIMLDMDGILADFVEGACVAHRAANPYEAGATGWNIVDLLNKTPDAFWAGMGYGFWANLRKTPEADSIVREAERAVGRSNIGILSTPCLTPGCIDGKLDWLKEHYPEFARSYCFTARKEFAASKSAVLIDDADHNADAFTAAGGHAVLYPRPWNTNRGKPYPLSYFRTALRQAVATIH